MNHYTVIVYREGVEIGRYKREISPYDLGSALAAKGISPRLGLLGMLDAWNKMGNAPNGMNLRYVYITC